MTKHLRVVTLSPEQSTKENVCIHYYFGLHRINDSTQTELKQYPDVV
jgi:hypothetical protein